MVRNALLIPAVFVLAVALAACSNASPAKAIAVTANALTYDTKEVRLERGQAAKLTFANHDVQLHDFSVTRIPVNVKESADGDMHHMEGIKPDLHVSADAGKAGTLEFTPLKAGTYTFYCTVLGHKDAGMVGTLVVS